MKRLPFILLFIFSLQFTLSHAQELGGTLTVWLKAGNSHEIAKNFDKRVDITINENADNYSSEQAEMILKDFLSKFSFRDFTVMHKGTSPDNAQYIIGTMKTNSGTFRTYIFIKKSGDTNLIQEIRFEKE